MIRFTYTDRFICHVDPITLTGIAIAALAGGGAAAATSGLFGGKGASQSATAQPAVAAPPPSAPPIQNPVGNKSSNKPQTPSFLGASSAPDQRAFGSKTLLGQ